MAILGGASSLTGPIVGGRHHHADQERGLDLMSSAEHAVGVTFVVVISHALRPRCPLHQLGDGYARAPRAARLERTSLERTSLRQATRVGSGRMTAPALEITTSEALRWPTRDQGRIACVMPGERRLDHRSERAGKTPCSKPDHRRLTATRARCGCSARIDRHADATARASRLARTYQISRCFRASGSFTTCAVAAGPRRRRGSRSC